MLTYIYLNVDECGLTLVATKLLPVAGIMVICCNCLIVNILRIQFFFLEI